MSPVRVLLVDDQALSRIEEEMWEAVDDPDWVKNYGSLPEELLGQLKACEGSHAG